MGEVMDLPITELFKGKKVERINAIEELVPYDSRIDSYSVATFLIK
jgi:hypothetical protein